MKFSKGKKRVTAALMSVLIAITTLFGTGTVVFAADEYETLAAPANGEKIWSVDPFDAEYSAGYFCISNSYGNNCDYELSYWGLETDCSNTNTEKDESIYIDHYNGACINGTYYDIREYVWCTDCDYWTVNKSGANGVRGTADARITREFHFYESGTLDSDNPVEVTFKGVMRLQDLDIEEGYTFDQGLVGVWLNELTHVTKRDDTTWKGTWENNNDGVNTERETLWVEVEGTPENPLTITYWGNKTHASAINYYGSSISYQLVENDLNALPEGAEPAVGTHCATYAAYNLMEATEFIRYEFSGWYTDAALTNLSATTIMVSSDLVFYGTYIKVAGLITTEVENGTITETDECVAYGTDKTIEYSPDEGYLLESVTVDGVSVDITQYPDSYTFTDVQDDHTIKVVYAKASMSKSVTMDGEDIDGLVISDGDEVTYTISYENPTGATRTVSISDAVPEGAEIIAESITDGGVYTDGTVTWTLQVPAYTKSSVSFRVVMTEESQGEIVKNTASVTFYPLDGSTSEKAVTLTDSVTSPLLADPTKSVSSSYGDVTNLVINAGDTLTYQISFANPAAEAKNFTVTDTIPNGVTLVSGSISDGGTVSGDVVTWNLTLSAGESKTVTFTVTVDTPSETLTKIYNQAVVSVDLAKKESVATEAPEGEDRTPVYVLDEPAKTVLNADGEDIGYDEDGNALQTVKQSGDTITYSITFSNPAVDARTFTVTDTLPEDVAFVSADNGGTYDEATHTVTWIVNVDGDAEQIVSCEVEILKSAEGTILKNTANVSVDAATLDTNTVETPVIATPVKDVVSALDGDSINNMPLQVGEKIYYTVTFTNPSDYEKTTVVTDVLPEGVDFVSADNDGVYDEETHTVTWTLTVAAHEEVTVSVKVKVNSDATGTNLCNQASVQMDEANVTTITKNGDDEEETTVNHVPAKLVVDEDGEDAEWNVVAVGDTVTYRITYNNSSNNLWEMTITDILPQGVLYVSSSDGGKVQSIVHGQTVIWNLEVPAHTEGYVEVTVKVTDELAGQTFANSAVETIVDEVTGQTKTVTTNEVSNYVLDDAVKVVLSENGRKDLSGETVAVATVLQYQITVQNPSTKDKVFTIMDEVPEGATFVSADNDGAYDEETGTVTWTLTVAAGKTATVTMFVEVAEDAAGSFVQNQAVVTVDGVSSKTNLVKTYVSELEEVAETEEETDDGEDAEEVTDTTEDTTETETEVTEGTETEETDEADEAEDTTETASEDADDSTATDSSDDSSTSTGTTVTSSTATTATTSSPKTGDNANLFLWSMLAGLSALAAGCLGGYVWFKRREKR